MKKLISTLVSLVVAFYAARFLVDLTLARDLMSHMNQCHEELHLKDRINTSLSESEIDALFADWGGCVKSKSNIIDRVFGSKLIDSAMDGMRDDRKKSGPYNARSAGRATGAPP